ncbi:MAG TPA: cysteine rich repeat-containing protein [Syntrophales bacterium]
MKRMNRIYPMILIAGFICLAMMPGAYAYAAEKNPCSDDIAKFCSNIKFGTPAMMNCLESHEGQLSAACKEYEATMEGKRVESMERVKLYTKFRQACSADVARFCSDADPKQGGTVTCLKGHANEISPACSETIKMIEAEE